LLDNIRKFKKRFRQSLIDEENMRILQGKLLQRDNMRRKDEIIENLQLAEFKVFSQFGDDGIIQFLADYLQPPNTFVELGVETYSESNTRFLLLNSNWYGFIVDGSPENMKECQNSYYYWRQGLTAHAGWVTKDNVNDLIKEHGKMSGEIGILNIDLDGNDYWIWEQVSVVNPHIVVMEYNSVFGLNPWTIPYDESFFRTKAHHSNLFYGVSVKALADLAAKKGYSFVGCNSAGNNAYFVRNDRLKGLKKKTAEEGYVESKFRESLDPAGNLTYLAGKERLESLRGSKLKVFNTETQNVEVL
jgi:hypothetical protein